MISTRTAFRKGGIVALNRCDRGRRPWLGRARKAKRRTTGALAALLAFLVAAPAAGRAEVVFTALLDGRWRVHVVGPEDGQAPRLLEGEIAGDQSAPAISPTSGSVAFEVQSGGLHVCARDGSDCRELPATDKYSRRPAWHPGGDVLAFAQYTADAIREDSDIFASRVSDSIRKPLITQTGGLDYPDFSPDGRRLAYTAAQTVSMHRAGVQVIQQLWTVDLRNGAASPLLPVAGQDIQPVWSPDSKQVAFASNRSGQFEIWVVGGDGRDLRRVTSGPGAKTWPAWSPDGRSLMYTLAREGAHSLWITELDGGVPQRFQPFSSDVQMRDADWR
jgi:Tol biopolymer transport system component